MSADCAPTTTTRGPATQRARILQHSRPRRSQLASRNSRSHVANWRQTGKTRDKTLLSNILSSSSAPILEPAARESRHSARQWRHETHGTSGPAREQVASFAPIGAETRDGRYQARADCARSSRKSLPANDDTFESPQISRVVCCLPPSTGSARPRQSARGEKRQISAAIGQRTHWALRAPI